MVKIKYPDQKVLVLDIEWKPTKALVWRAFDENVSPDQIIEHGGLLCVGAKWLGTKKVMFFSEWQHGHKGMLQGIYDLMSEADALVGFNSDKFDIPKLIGEFVLYDFPPCPPCSQIDCYKAIKKFGYFMGRLAFVGPFLGVGKKIEHEGINLWKKVEAGDERAQRRMERYCVQDVRLTERLYIKIRPHIRNHPHLGKTGAAACPSCGGYHSHSRGSVRTRCYKKQRLQCQDCGHWFHGKQTKI